MSSNLTDSFLQEDPIQDSYSALSRSESNDSSSSSTELVRVASSIISSDRTSSAEYPITITDPPSPRLQLTPAFQESMVSHKMDYHPTFVVICDDEYQEGEPTYFVTEELINQWNSEIGNTQNPKKAHALIKKMRKLGGLDSHSSKIDIPSARIGLCYLACLDNQDNKMYALNSLLEILKNDSYEQRNSNRLVKLATLLLEQMEREVIQAVDLEAQTKIAEVYNVLTETLHQHFGKGHINGITNEFKALLVQASKSLAKLNRLEDVRLNFNVKCAFEGVRRLKDDKKELFSLVEAIYNVAASANAVYQHDPVEAFEKLKKAFNRIDERFPNSSYNAILILKSLARDVKGDPDKLFPLFMLIEKKYKKLNWKFTYAAVETLFRLALHGENENVRLRAFTGIKQFSYHFPGITSFADCSTLRKYISLKPMTHLELPQRINPNMRIRQACIEGLLELVAKSKDAVIIQKAQTLLNQRASQEKDPTILKTLQKRHVLLGHQEKEDSVEEEKPHDWTTTLDPARRRSNHSVRFKR